MTDPKIDITKIDPNSGPFVGGTKVTITVEGEDLDKPTFDKMSPVAFGGMNATIVRRDWGGTTPPAPPPPAPPVVKGKGTITVTSPAHAAGPVDITVLTPGGYPVTKNN